MYLRCKSDMYWPDHFFLVFSSPSLSPAIVRGQEISSELSHAALFMKVQLKIPKLNMVDFHI